MSGLAPVQTSSGVVLIRAAAGDQFLRYVAHAMASGQRFLGMLR
jgi:hypothetical protein